MPGLNEADRTEIRALITNYRTGGIPIWIKESLALAIVMVGAGFVIYHYIPAQIGSQTSTMASDLSGLKESVGTLKTDVSDIKRDIKEFLNKALDRAYPAMSPTGKRSSDNIRGAIEFSNSILQLANNLGVTLNKGVAYGNTAIVLASADPNIRNLAWRGANLSLDQRSLLNAALVPSRERTQNVPSKLAWTLPGPVLGEPTPLGRLIPGSEGALADKLEERAPPGEPHIQVHIRNEISPEFLLVDRADTIIDEYRLKQLIYRNSHITYRGGRVAIELVFFVNCTFDIAQTKEGERFIKAILESAPMSFSSSGD